MNQAQNWQERPGESNDYNANFSGGLWSDADFASWPDVDFVEPEWDAMAFGEQVAARDPLLELRADMQRTSQTVSQSSSQTERAALPGLPAAPESGYHAAMQPTGYLRQQEYVLPYGMRVLPAARGWMPREIALGFWRAHHDGLIAYLRATNAAGKNGFETLGGLVGSSTLPDLEVASTFLWHALEKAAGERAVSDYWLACADLSFRYHKRNLEHTAEDFYYVLPLLARYLLKAWCSISYRTYWQRDPDQITVLVSESDPCGWLKALDQYEVHISKLAPYSGL